MKQIAINAMIEDEYAYYLQAMNKIGQLNIQ